MDASVLWVIAACILGAGEIATTSFYLAPFAVGAGAAAIADAVGLGLIGSSLVFLAVSIFLFVFVGPIARRHLHQPAHLRSGTAALTGAPAVVMERIANTEGVGVAKINGEIWTARAFDDERTFEAGEQVQVMEIRGATALVD